MTSSSRLSFQIKVNLLIPSVLFTVNTHCLCPQHLVLGVFTSRAAVAQRMCGGVVESFHFASISETDPSFTFTKLCTEPPLKVVIDDEEKVKAQQCLNHWRSHLTINSVKHLSAYVHVCMWFNFYTITLLNDTL